MYEDNNKKSLNEKSNNRKNMDENESQEDKKDKCGGECKHDNTKCKECCGKSDCKLNNINKNNVVKKVCDDSKDSIGTSKVKNKRTLILTCKEENLVLDSEETNVENESDQSCSKCGKEKTKNKMCCKCMKKVEKRVIRAALSTPKLKKINDDFEISAKKKLYETFVSESSSYEVSEIHSSDSEEWGLDYIEECIEKIKPKKEKIKEKIITKKTDVNEDKKFDEDTESFWQHSDTSKIFSSFSEEEEEAEIRSRSKASTDPEISDLLRGENIRDDVFTSSNLSTQNPIYQSKESEENRSFESLEEVDVESFTGKNEKEEESLSNNKTPNIILYGSENLKIQDKKGTESDHDLTCTKENGERLKNEKEVETIKTEKKEEKEGDDAKDDSKNNVKPEEIIFIEENGNGKILGLESDQENENTNVITRNEGFSGIFTSLGLFFAGASIATTAQKNEHHKPSRDTQSSPELLDLLDSDSLAQNSDENNSNNKNIAEEISSSEKSASGANGSDENISTKEVSVSMAEVKKEPGELLKNTNIYENVDGSSLSDATKSSKEISNGGSTKSKENVKYDPFSTLSSEISENFPVQKGASFSKYHVENPNPTEAFSENEVVKDEKISDAFESKSKPSEDNPVDSREDKIIESNDPNKKVLDDRRTDNKGLTDQSIDKSDISSIKSSRESGHLSLERSDGNQNFSKPEEEKSSNERLDNLNKDQKEIDNKQDSMDNTEKSIESSSEKQNGKKIETEPKEELKMKLTETSSNSLSTQSRFSSKTSSTEEKDEKSERKPMQEIKKLPEERLNSFKPKEQLKPDERKSKEHIKLDENKPKEARERKSIEEDKEIIQPLTSDQKQSEYANKPTKDINKVDKNEDSNGERKPSDVVSEGQESGKSEPKIGKIQEIQKLECQAELEKVSEIKTASKIISKNEENVSEKTTSDSIVVNEKEEPTEKFVVTHYNLKSGDKNENQNKKQTLASDLTQDQEELQRLETSMNNPIFIYFDTIRTDSATNSRKLRTKGKGRVARLVEYFENIKNLKKDSKK
ncbi:hypothetical protein CWI39_0018p0030 [Hamiltosporidium magnivora]|uniref:Uncharacterized protein n=1 Tax=Hamiltosporidium magnivora TaxID=148818 RepID=A0A4V2JX08_9MICR|nr:hypothetical protein CWI39_0018p0030 [Hamiltosporidium magnivora]